ncbi:MAG: hypothetical protein JWN82_593 [Candidatus Saccharibacteria bacterium]|nr:hypothetical protein [Candidatus Saccharibacteria bacterium]
MRIVHSLLSAVKRTPRWVFSLLFFGLIAAFLVLYLQSIDWEKIGALSINWWRIGIASITGLSFLYLGAFIWRAILRALGATDLPSYGTTTDVYARAWMGRYIPGTVTWIAGKVYLASGWGISKSRLAVASLLEGGSQVAAMTFVSFLLLGFDTRLDVLSSAAQLALIGLGLLVLIILIPQVFNHAMHLAFKTLRRGAASEELRINGAAVRRAFSLYVVGTFLMGSACFFVIWSVVPGLHLYDIWFVVGTFGLATVAGMAAPFAPSGLGIRDGVQLVLLTAIMPKELALAATVLVRLWSVCLDLLFLGLTRPSLYRFGRNSYTKS